MPSTLIDIRAGDKVVVTGHKGDKLRTVTKRTERYIYLGEDMYTLEGLPRYFPMNRKTIRPASVADVMRHEIAEMEADRARQEKDAYDAREDVGIARQLASVDETGWLNLGIDELRRIALVLGKG